jgi:hypothetical protein
VFGIAYLSTHASSMFLACMCMHSFFLTPTTMPRRPLHTVDPTLQVYSPAVAALRAAGIPEATIQQRVNEAIACKTTMFSPSILLRAGVPVTRIVQNAGEIVVTFPRGYHAGFSTGTNIGEAANFALRNWAEFGIDGAVRALRLRTTPVRYPLLRLQDQLQTSCMQTSWELLQISCICCIWEYLAVV